MSENEEARPDRPYDEGEERKRRRQYGEKDEKEEEKQDEKEEKGDWDEKWRRDPLNAAAWACIIIWAGVVLLADNLGILLRFEKLGTWSFILAGAGVIIIIEALIRLAVPEYRKPVTGSIIFGIVLLAIALGDFISWGAIWAVALIALGLYWLLRGLSSRR